MTKVFITGATSRATNPLKNKRDVMVSSLIAEICRDLGYDVEHGDPAIERDLAEFDHVFCALAPLHGLGANRIYGALATVLRTYGTGRLSLYLDDSDTRKIVNGIKTMTDDPYRFTKPFFVYRKEYEIARQPEWNKWLMSGVELLRDHPWPTTLVPAFPWANAQQLLRGTPNVDFSNSVFFDPSAYLPKHDVSDIQSRQDVWVTESTDQRWLDRQRTSWPVQRYGKGFDKRPIDEQLVRAYAGAGGVLDLGEDHGWWSSRMGYAAETRTPYFTRWQNVSGLGGAYGELPDAFEQLSPAQRIEFGYEQADIFAKVSETRDSLREKIEKLVLT